MIIRKMMELCQEKGIVYRRLLSYLVTYIDDQAKQARDQYVDENDYYDCYDGIEEEQYEGLVTRKLRCYNKKEILLSLAKDKVIRQDINIFSRDNAWLLHLIDLGFSTHHILVDRCNDYNRKDIRKKWVQKGIDKTIFSPMFSCREAAYAIARSFPQPIKTYVGCHAILNKSKGLKYSQEIEDYINWLTKEIKKGNIRLID